MSYANKTFHEISREVAEDFLQSVVVVDDQAYLHTQERVESLSPPARGRGAATPGSRAAAGLPERSPAADERSRQNLDAKALIDAFADAGLVCAVLRPRRGDGGKRTLETKTDRATQRADIVILDWRIRDDEVPGTTTLGLVEKIIASDQPDRLRLIAVYTGEPDLPQIADRIEAFLNQSMPEQVVRQGDVFNRGAVRITLYAKAGGRVANEVAAARAVAEADLPKRLIDEFAEMTQGLLSNVALKSLGALRANTHRLIRKFGTDLDAPYLAHRALMVPPEEAEQHPVPLLSSELQDVLEDRAVTSLVSPPVLEAWLKAEAGNGLSLDGKLDGMSGDDVREALLDLIDKGLKHETVSGRFASWADLLKPLKDISNRDGLSKITDLLTPDGVAGQDRDMELAVLMGIRSRYDAPDPVLTLGAVVAEEVGGRTRYLLCVQPPCDSVRISDKRCFPFLKLVDAATSAAKDFDVVVRDGAEKKALRIDFHPYASRLIEFRPKRGQREIRAAKEQDRWVFQTVGDLPNLRWVADLKPAQAQRAANRYGSTISRVGLTESEWLRRMARSDD